MKIAFLCGSLEPGRDGVGDYTARLMIELIRQGHEVTAVALNDKFTHLLIDKTAVIEDATYSFLRLPSSWSYKQRFKYAKKRVTNFDPDWVSLQFVIFSFHDRGLPFGISSLIADLGKDRHWHIMFHELWVGMSTGTSIKYVFWGYLQRYLIKQLILTLNPVVIHTQSQLYFSQLIKLNYVVKRLPLFSNIPVKYTHLRNSSVITLVVFGTIHPNTLLDRLVEEVSAYKIRHGAEVQIKLIGVCGSEEERWINAFESSGIVIKTLGRQSTDRISRELSEASLGIATGSTAMIDKSGTVAAMLAHGLPVLCISQPWYARGVPLPEPLSGVYNLLETSLESCLTKPLEVSCSPDAATISKVLIESLQASLPSDL